MSDFGGDAQQLAAKERELLRMRENYESTMSKLKEQRVQIEESMRKGREESQATQMEVNRLKGQIANNKRMIEEQEAMKRRVKESVSELQY